MKRFLILFLSCFIVFSAAAKSFDGYMYEPFTSKNKVIKDLKKKGWKIEDTGITVIATPPDHTAYLATSVDYIKFGFDPDDDLFLELIVPNSTHSVSKLLYISMSLLAEYEYTITNFKHDIEHDLSQTFEIEAKNDNSKLDITILTAGDRGCISFLYSYYN